jgi:UDP-glucose 4-epimerase
MRKISSKKRNRYIVTGAASMIGIALVKECVKQGAEVAAVVRPGSNNNKNVPQGARIRIVPCALDNLKSLPAKLNGKYDVFFHLGWADTDKKGRNDRALQKANVGFTLDAVKAAKKAGCKVFLGAGTQAEYGNASGKISEKKRIAPQFAYAAAKCAAGRLSAALCGKLGLKHVWARVFSVYGPYNRQDNMMMYCIGTLLKGKKPAMTKGEQLWDYMYCSDAARALILAALKGRGQNIYNIGSGTVKLLREYVKIIRNAVNPGLEIGFGEIDYPAGQVMYLCADISKLRKDTGFKPVVPFNKGIKEMINWYRENIK